MIYLKKFKLLSEDDEQNIEDRRRIFNSYYPLSIFWRKGLQELEFSKITIISGSNGSGKSTLLNIIAEKIGAARKSKIDKGSYFSLYVNSCNFEMSMEKPIEIKVLTSDDIFDYLLNIRSINSGVNNRKEYLTNEWLNLKFNKESNSIENYEELKKVSDAKHKTMSNYIRQHLGNNNIIEQSNGESSLLFFENEIKESAIYILDEPENSLSAENQLKLKKFIEDSARFYNCQFIISTHSPFLLSLNDAVIYDLDSNPVNVKKWTEIKSVQTYYNFFKDNQNEFKNN